jgi:hypothetical protein
VGDPPIQIDDRYGLQILNLALMRGMVSREQWSVAIERYSAGSGGGRSLAEHLLELHYLTPKQLSCLHEEIRNARIREKAPPSLPPAPAPPPEGPVPFGRFMLRREIGRGGRGSVYEAVDTLSGQRVAVKLIRNSPDTRPEELAREEEWFLREAETALRLPDHPGIVRVLASGIAQGKRWLSLELVEGVELDRWAALHPDPRGRVAVLRDIALAVHAAHEAGFVHRDLKPRNILVDAHGRPRVTDFGTARSVRQDPRASVTAWGNVVGTAVYMSPEQARDGADVDPRADVYSLGVMLYEFLCGRAPFEGGTAIDTIMKALHRPLRRPSEQAPGRRVDPDLERICLRALARERADRTASALEFADDLDAWLHGNRRARLSARAKRLLGAVLLAGVAVAAAVSLRSRPAPAPPDTGAVSFVPGRPDGAGGILLLDRGASPLETGAHAGRPFTAVTAVEGGWGLLPLDVDDAWSAGAALVGIEVDYLDDDVPVGYFGVQYDSTDERLAERGALKWGGTVWLGGSGIWKTWRGILPDPRFGGRQPGGSDLRIYSGVPALRLGRVSLRKIELDRAARLHPEAFRAEAVDPASLLPGLRADFFRGRDLRAAAGTRTDPGIAFIWDGGSGPFGLTDDFSARWSGWLRVPKTGRYLLELESDNGARLLLHGRTVLERWEAHASTTDLVLCDLEEGLHPFTLEYYEELQRASVLFSCLAPSGGRMVELSHGAFFHRP